MRTSTLFGANNFGFFEIYGASARTRGVEPVWILRTTAYEVLVAKAINTIASTSERSKIFCETTETGRGSI